MIKSVFLARVALPVLLSLSACAVHEPYQRPETRLPPAWTGHNPAQTAALGASTTGWWRTFEDPSLIGLVDAVIANNHDLRAASLRIDQARSFARQTTADRYPALSGGIGIERTRPLSTGGATNQFTVDGTIGFEPDLWDKFANLSRSAQSQVDAASESERVIRLTLTADAAVAYFEHAASAQRLDLAQRSLAVAERIDGIVGVRYRNGAVSGLDRAQSKTSLSTIRATLPSLEQALAQSRLTMALLAGKQPYAMDVAAPRLTDVRLPERLPVGLPTEILLRRPDIRLVEANLRSAHADIGVARANLYPSLRLTSELGFASPELSNLLKGSSGLLGVGAALLTPIFQAGRLQAVTERTRHRHAELVQTYHQTVLGSLREVEGALVALEKLAAQEAMQKEVIEHAGEAFRLAEVRYKAGSVDALTLLSTQNTLLGAENSALQTRMQRISSLIALYRALGGGW